MDKTFSSAELGFCGVAVATVVDKTLLFAQGMGFYGVAVATVDLTVAECEEKLQNKYTIYKSKEGTTLGVTVNPDDSSGLEVMPNPGITVPGPCILVDTGHGVKDLELLKDVLAILKK